MPLMDKMRAGTDSFLIQAVFVIIIVSFVFWGAGNNGPTSSVVAEVNGQRITDTEFGKVLQRYANSQDGPRTNEALAQMRQEVLGQLILEEVIEQEAHRLGMDVSDDEVNRAIFRTQAFRDESGKFSMEIYERTLKRMGMSRTSYEAEIYTILLRDKLRGVVISSVRVNPEEVKRTWLDEKTRLDLVWVKVPDAAFMSKVTPADDEVAAYAASQADRIKATYDEQYQRRFRVPRKATLSTILLRTDIDGVDKDAVKARLEAIRADIEGGQDFAEAARKWSEDITAMAGGNLGTQADEQLDPVIAEAVFAEGAGPLTAVLETSRGFQLVRVSERTPAQETSLADATELLAREMIQAERAPALAGEFAEQLLAAWKAEGQVPAAMVGDAGLFSQDATDQLLSRLGASGLPVSDKLAEAVRAAADGEVLPEVYSVADDRYIVQVVRRVAPEESSFEMESRMLEQRLLMTERMRLLQEWQDSLVAGAEVKRYL